MNGICNFFHAKWEKLRDNRINEKHLFYLSLSALILLLIPMLIIAFYDVPSVDDFGYGLAPHQTWLESHSIFLVLQTVVQQIKHVYHTWQGSFFSIFLFSLQPGVFNERFYFLTPFIMLASLCGGTVFFLKVVLGDLLGASIYQRGIVTVMVLAACLEFCPNPAQAFYWYNGSVYYTFTSGLSLILFGELLSVFGRKVTPPAWSLTSLSPLFYPCSSAAPTW